MQRAYTMQSKVEKNRKTSPPPTAGAPKISVAIISYNNAAYIEKTIQSILAQSLPPAEIVIQDDCSNDTTWDIIQRFVRDHPLMIKAFQNNFNIGIAANLNAAIKNCSGDLLTWVAGDDRFKPAKLEMEWEALKIYTDCHIAYSNVETTNADGHRTGTWDGNTDASPSRGNIFLHVFTKRLFPGRRNLFRSPLLFRDVFDTIGPFDEKLDLFEDFDWKIRATYRHRTVYIPKPLVEYRIHDQGAHNSARKDLYRSIKKVVDKNLPLLDAYPRVVSDAVQAEIQAHVDTHRPSSIARQTSIIPTHESHDHLVFLISLPRAGSTLLQRILGGHRQIFSAGETWLMLHPLFALKQDRLRADFESQYAATALRDFLALFPEKDQLYFKAVRHYGLTFYNRALQASGRKLFLDKTPRYYMILPELMRVFPDARYVFLMRNPLAILSSMLQTWFGNNPQALRKNKNYDDLVQAPKLILQAIDALQQRASIVHYEQLVQRPQETIKTLCRQLHLSYQPDMLIYGDKPSFQGRLGDPVGVQKHDRPVPSNLDKWIGNLTDKTRREFAMRVMAEIGEDTIMAMGYDAAQLARVIGSDRSASPTGTVKKHDLVTDAPVPSSKDTATCNPIVICQMGKVGSTSIMNSLSRYNVPNQQIHFLAPQSIAKAEAYYQSLAECAVPDHLRRSRIVHNRMIRAPQRTPWKIISLVRDPVARAISSVLQNQSYLFPNLEKLNDADKIDHIKRHLLGEFARFDSNEDYACTWFDKEIKSTIGFDIFAQPFDQHNGFQIYHHDAFDILIMRTENLSECAPIAFQKFIGIDNFKLSNANIGDKKNYRLIRRRLLECLEIPEKALERIYGSRLVRHFYTPAEIDTFKRRWQSKSSKNTKRIRTNARGVSRNYPKISIVTPSLNQAQYLEKCISSILNQKYPNLEYIIMDGGSSDGSIDIIKKYAKYLHYWQSKPDGGHYGAVNEGFSKTTGEIMAWLNSDDMLHPDALFKLAHLFETYPKVEWILGRSTIWDAQGRIVNTEEPLKRWKRENLLNGDFKWIQQESSFWKRSLWDRAGSKIDETYELAGDLELWCRFFRYAPVYRTDAMLGGYRYHGDQRAQLFMAQYIDQAGKILEQERMYFANSEDKRLIPSPEPLIIDDAAWRFYKAAPKSMPRPISGASTRLEKCANTPPACLQAYEQAQKYGAQGQIDKAEEILTNLTEEFPEFALAYNDLGVLHCHSGRNESALSLYQRAVVLDPSSRTARLNLAEFLHVIKEDRHGALKLYLELLQSTPEATDVLYGIGRVCLDLGQIEDARSFFDRIVAIDPHHKAAHEAMVQLHLSTNNCGPERWSPLSRHNHHPRKSRFRVSAIVSVYASERFIEGRLQNLIDQTLYMNGELEIIIVDSNSPENEQAIVERYLEQYSGIRYLRTPVRETVYSAWNRGIEIASGTYCVNANTDDRFTTDALETMADVLDTKPEYDAVYGNWVVTRTPNDTFESSNDKRLFIYPDFDPGLFFYLQITSHANFVRRSVFDRIGMFDGNYTVFGDREFMLRFCAHGHRALKIEKTIGLYLENPTSVERANKDIGAQECAGLYERYMAPDQFATLMGFPPDVSAKTLARAYSHSGCLGMGLYQVDGNPHHALGSPAKLFAHAIELDPENAPALNNMGVIALCHQAPQEAQRFFITARQKAAEEQIPVVDHNLFLAKNNTTDANQLQFIFPPDFEPIRVVDTNYRHHQDTLRNHPNPTDKKSSTKPMKKNRLKRRKGRRHLETPSRRPKAASTPAPIQPGSEKLRSAWKAYLTDDLSRAVAILDGAIQAHPDDWEAYTLLLDVMLQAGQEDGILRWLRPLENRSDLPADMLALIGSGYEAAGNIANARRLADQALKADHHCARGWNLLGVIAYRRGDLQAAADHFRQAIRHNAGWGDPWTNQGTLLWEQGQTDEALDCFEKGFQLSPAAPNVVTTYHIAVSETGQYDRAKVVFEQVVQRHPDFRKALLLLIDILIRQEAYPAALDWIEFLLVRFGTEPQILEAAKMVRAKVGPMRFAKKKRPTLSLCMIVKNEDRHLARCLASLKPLVDEMIIVDTGSTDNTRDIAGIFGAKVFDVEWTEDFAAARNFSLEHASGDWILVMDADEVIAPDDHKALRGLIRKHHKQNVAFSIVTRNYTQKYNGIGWVANAGINKEVESGCGWTPSEKVRLFKNNPNIRFRFPVHELVDPALKNLGHRIKKCSVAVHHYGYLDLAKVDRKGALYYEIGKKKLEEMENDPIALQELAVQADLLEKHDEAIDLWKRLSAIQPNNSKAYINLSATFGKMGRYRPSKDAADKAIKIDPSVKEGYLNLGRSEFFLGNFSAACNVFKKVLEVEPQYYAAIFMLGAAELCCGHTERGMATIKRLKPLDVWRSLPYAFQDLTRNLFHAGFGDSANKLVRTAATLDLLPNNHRLDGNDHLADESDTMKCLLPMAS